MAKFGEGDKRWIVDDRPDGTNVHNWHWSERDCLDWSRSFLASHLNGLTLLDGKGDLVIRTKALDNLSGEAYVNIRKGKIIPGYELSISISFEAEAAGAKVSGSIEIPYLADENADEDPEIRVVVRDDEGPLGNRIKDAILAEGKPIVCEKIRIYVQAMAKGGPAKDDLEVKKPPPKTNSNSPTAGAPGKNAPSTAGAAPAAVKKEEKKKGKEGFKTITMSEKFYCRAADMYEILMDENRWKGFTQSNARISRDVGGQISLFDGSVTGSNEDLQIGKLIVQKWRFGSWPDGVYSTVRLVFDEPEPGVTIIKLTHTDVPEEDRYGNATVVENTERGWRDLIFHKIRTMFGFGI